MPKKSNGKLRVVVVDGEPGLLERMKLWLMARYEVFCLASGKKALKELGKIQPDLLIIDTSVPAPEGAKERRALLSDGHLGAIPMLYLTAPRDDMENGALDAPEYACLRKPVDGRQLHAKLEELLNSL